MDQPSRPSASGGFFLIVAILAGFAIGSGIGRALEGSLVGLGVGIAAAVATWLVDRRRGRR
jgi:hypothetical protein